MGTHGHRLPWAGCDQQGDAEDRNRAGSQGARPRDEFLESSNGVKAKKKKSRAGQPPAAPGCTRSAATVLLSQGAELLHATQQLWILQRNPPPWGFLEQHTRG